MNIIFTYMFVLGLVFPALSCCRPVVSKINLNETQIDNTGKKDVSHQINNILQNKNFLVLTRGTYRVDSSLFIRGTLLLKDGATLFRSAVGGSTTPVLVLNHSHSKVIGVTTTASVVSEVPHRNGMIRIGHVGTKKNVLYTELQNLTLVGAGTQYDRNLAIQSLSLQGVATQSANYFHRLHNLNIRKFSQGIELLGASNANSITGIFFDRVGSKKSHKAISIVGSMENRISDVFHHYSPNSTTIFISRDQKFIPQFNWINGVVAEQGGKDAFCLRMENGTYNQIHIGCNTKKGAYILPKLKRQHNSFLIN